MFGHMIRMTLSEATAISERGTSSFIGTAAAALDPGPPPPVI